MPKIKLTSRSFMEGAEGSEGTEIEVTDENRAACEKLVEREGAVVLDENGKPIIKPKPSVGVDERIEAAMAQYEIAAEKAEAKAAAEKKRADAAEKKVVALEKKLDAVTKERDALKAAATKTKADADKKGGSRKPNTPAETETEPEPAEAK